MVFYKTLNDISLIECVQTGSAPIIQLESVLFKPSSALPALPDVSSRGDFQRTDHETRLSLVWMSVLKLILVVIVVPLLL